MLETALAPRKSADTRDHDCIVGRCPTSSAVDRSVEMVGNAGARSQPRARQRVFPRQMAIFSNNSEEGSLHDVDGG